MVFLTPPLTIINPGRGNIVTVRADNCSSLIIVNTWALNIPWCFLLKGKHFYGVFIAPCPWAFLSCCRMYDGQYWLVAGSEMVAGCLHKKLYI